MCIFWVSRRENLGVCLVDYFREIRVREGGVVFVLFYEGGSFLDCIFW